MQKRHIIVFIVFIVVSLLVWKLSSSYAIYNPGYDGKNIIVGDKWGVNIVEIGEVKTTGKAILTDEISTIGTTLNFGVSLFEKGDTLTFDFTVKNLGKLDAELYATTITGLSRLDSEVISYDILPLEYANIHEDEKEGSIIRKDESQSFRITIKYENNVATNNKVEYNLGLGSTIIYKQH